MFFSQTWENGSSVWGLSHGLLAAQFVFCNPPLPDLPLPPTQGSFIAFLACLSQSIDMSIMFAIFNNVCYGTVVHIVITWYALVVLTHSPL